MGLIFWGEVDAASDATMTAVTLEHGSSFRAAVIDLIEATLAGSQVVADAAAVAAAEAVGEQVPPAVAAEIVASSLVSGVPDKDTPRSSRSVVPVDFVDRTRSVFYPGVYPSVYPAASWSAGVRRRADVPVLDASGRLDPAVVPVKAPGVLTGLQVQATPGGALVFEVRPDGETYVKGVRVGAGGDAGTTVTRVVMVPALGQSNQVAHGLPVVPLLDGESSRIFELADGATLLTPARVPLGMPGGTADGLSPAHVLAREIALRDPECVVVIVPAAKGGSGLVADPSQGYGKWEIGYTGPNPHLYDNAVAAMLLAVQLAGERWPGITPSVVTAWLQGEQDGAEGIARAVYEAALDALIQDWQSRFGGVFLIAGIVPQAATSGTRPEIVLGLQDTPRRVEQTAFVPGVDNGGGARGPSDVIHYGREAIELIGRGWYEAIPAASNNVAGSHTTPPVSVEVSRWADLVSVTWSAPFCRVSSFEVQSSADGVSWNAVAMPEPVARSVSFASSVPVLVRVRTVGTETSNWTKPVGSDAAVRPDVYVPLSDATGAKSLAAVTASQIIHWTLTGNVTISAMPSTPFAGQEVTLVMTQDATGGRTVTLPAGVLASSGLKLPLETGAGAKTVWHLWWSGVAWVAYLAGRDVKAIS